MSQKRKRIFILAIATFIVVVCWIGFNIHHGFTTSTISETENIIINPISPNFDTKAISELSQRKQVDPITILTEELITTQSAEPILPLSSPSATPAVNPTVTPSQQSP